MPVAREICECTVDAVKREGEDSEFDLWVLFAPGIGALMFEVPHGGEPQVERMAGYLNAFFDRQAEYVVLAPVQRRYTVESAQLVADMPEMVQ